MNPVNILCTKWGTKYGADYVNRLYSMVSRNIARPYRFVCLTDDSTGLRPEVEAFALPLIDIPDFDAKAAWTKAHGWLKLTCFANAVHDLSGPTLYLDIDIVITGGLDVFFEPEGEFIAIKEWDKRDDTGNTSVFRFIIGAHSDALIPLRQDIPEATKTVRNEQEYITQYISRQGKLKYWPAEWCRSFKRHCVRPFPLSWFQPPRLPENARVIAFHGKPNPPDAIVGDSGKWYRKVLPTDWVKEHWR